MAANRPLSKTFCEVCGQVFTPRDAMQTYQNRYFHPHCFCCASCGNSIAGKPFYPKPNNQFQCENCNNALAPVYEKKQQQRVYLIIFFFCSSCCICNQKIQSGTKAKRFQERHYHSDCFRYEFFVLIPKSQLILSIFQLL